jgi:hypothetical protein
MYHFTTKKIPKLRGELAGGVDGIGHVDGVTSVEAAQRISSDELMEARDLLFRARDAQDHITVKTVTLCQTTQPHRTPARCEPSEHTQRT